MGYVPPKNIGRKNILPSIVLLGKPFLDLNKSSRVGLSIWG